MTGLHRMILSSLLLGASLAAARPARAEGPGGGEVTAVSLAPAAGKAEVVIAVRGAVEVKDFLLTSPDRLVLDVVGATLGQNAPAVYDGVKRGVVTDLRYSQFRPDVVRIVLDLDGPTTYKVQRAGDAIRIAFGPAAKFQAWTSKEAHEELVDETPAARGQASRGRPEARPRRGAEPGRRAPDHRHLGSGQHRRRGGRVRGFQRPDHHSGQGYEG